MRLTAFLASVAMLVWGPALAQFDGVPSTPNFAATQTSPLTTFKVRLGIPFLTHGPAQDWGDWVPTFIPTGSGSFYAYSANQQTFGTMVAGLTTPTCGTMPCGQPSSTATFTGSISGSTLTVSGVSGTIAAGQVLGGNSITGGATVANGTSITGGSGSSWTVSPSQTVPSIPMATYASGTTLAGSTGAKCNQPIPSYMTQTFPSGSVNPVSPAVSSDSCGDWITAAIKIGNIWYADVHNEGPADYTAAATSNESEGLWASTTGAPGNNWTLVSNVFSGGTIASSDIGAINGALTGIGDGTISLDSSGQYAYFYGSFFCATATCDYHNVIARASTHQGAAAVVSSTNISVSGQVFTFAGLPAAGDQISIDGSVITFVTSGASCASGTIAIAGSVSAQVSALKSCLTSTTDNVLSKFVYLTTSNTLIVGAALAPGQWKILYQGSFSGQALNNHFNSASQLPLADWYGVADGNRAGYFPTEGFVGSSVSSMPAPYTAIAVDYRQHGWWKYYPFGQIGGIAISIAQDHVHFYTYPWPLLNFDFDNFANRADGVGGCTTSSPPDPSGSCGDLFLYGMFHSDTDGGNSLAATHATFWTMWTPPNNSLSHRYLAGYPATFSQRSATDINNNVPQAGVTLETYVNSSTGNPYSGHARSTTVHPGPASAGFYETGWAPSSFLGYTMTNCPGTAAPNAFDCDSGSTSVASRIEECWLASSDDYGLKVDTGGTSGSCPSGWVHVRTAGWVYKSPQSFGTKPVYECFNSGGGYHFASNDSTCGGQTPQGLLGYALAN